MRPRSLPLILALWSTCAHAADDNAAAPSIAIRTDGPWAKSVSTLPDYSTEDAARLDVEGMRALFADVCALPEPAEVRWLGGGFRIRKLKQTMSGAVSAFFSIPPAQATAFADALEAAWKARFAAQPTFHVRRSRSRRSSDWPQPYLKTSAHFNSGTLTLQCRDRDAVKATHDFQAYVDTSSGLVWIRSYKGRLERD